MHLRNSFFLTLLALFVAQSAGASDFSGLANPAFGRSLLISPERQNELNCAALAYLPYQKMDMLEVADEVAVDATDVQIAAPVQQQPSIVFEELLTKTQAEDLKAQVILRVLSDVGDREMAIEMFAIRMHQFAPAWDVSDEAIAQKARVRDAVKPGCASIFEAAQASNLANVLASASAEPIALPDVNTCLAYDRIAQKSRNYANYDFLHGSGSGDVYTRIVGPKGAQRTAREAEIAAVATRLEPIEPEIAGSRLIACLPVFAKVIRSAEAD